MRKLLYATGLLLGCLALAWFLIIKPKIEASVYRNLVQIAPNLKEQDISIFPFGLRINSSTDAMLGAMPVSLSKPALQLDTLSLLSLKPALSFTAGLLGGDINAVLNSSRSFDQFDSKFVIKQVKLSEHPLIKLCGLSSGILNIELTASGLKQAAIPDLKLSFKAEDLTTTGQKLPSFISKFPLRIPALTNGNLTVRGSCSAGSCQSDTLEFISSLGEIKGKALVNNINAHPQIDLNLDFALTKIGKEQILPLISLFNPKIMDNPDRPVSLKMRGPLNSAIVSVVARQ